MARPGQSSGPPLGWQLPASPAPGSGAASCLSPAGRPEGLSHSSGHLFQCESVKL